MYCGSSPYAVPHYAWFEDYILGFGSLSYKPCVIQSSLEPKKCSYGSSSCTADHCLLCAASTRSVARVVALSGAFNKTYSARRTTKQFQASPMATRGSDCTGNSIFPWAEGAMSFILTAALSANIIVVSLATCRTT